MAGPPFFVIVKIGDYLAYNGFGWNNTIVGKLTGFSVGDKGRVLFELENGDKQPPSFLANDVITKLEVDKTGNPFKEPNGAVIAEGVYAYYQEIYVLSGRNIIAKRLLYSIL